MSVSITSPTSTTTQLLQNGSPFLTVDSSLNVTIPQGLSITGTATFAGGLNIDSGTLYVDNVNNYVGIGTTSPSVPLDVYSTGSVQGKFIRNNTGSASGGITVGNNSGTFTFYADTALQIYGGSTERMRIDSSGNVGIGTASPGYKLDVNGNARLQGTAAGSNVKLYLDTTSGSASNYVGITNDYYTTLYCGRGSTAQLDLTNGATILFSTNSLERMRIDSSGNVGIGTSSPSTKLDVNGSVTISGTNGAVNSPVFQAFPIYSGVYSPGTSPALWQSASGVLSISTNASERMRIDSSGNVGIGVTSPVAKLDVQGDPSSSLLKLQSTVAADSANRVLNIVKYANDSTTSQNFITFAINQGATGSGKINANGASAAAFGTFSDSRLKENIESLPNQLDNIMALKPCEFDYKDGSGHQIGFIAQEMQEVYPDVVSEDEDQMLTITGWDKTSARLVKAIQEQQAQIEELKAAIAELKA